MAISTPAATFDEERLSSDLLADFRCERCLGRYPNTTEFLVVQDGAKLCRPNCAYREAPSERELLRQEATIDAAQQTSDAVFGAAELFGKAAVWSLMDGVSAVTAITSGLTRYPQPIALHLGGTAPIVLSGVLLSAADTISFSNSNLTIGVVAYAPDQTSASFTVTAGGLIPLGDYDFFYNGTRFPKAFSVR